MSRRPPQRPPHKPPRPVRPRERLAPEAQEIAAQLDDPALGGDIELEPADETGELPNDPREAMPAQQLARFDTVFQRDKKSGRARPAPSRGVESIVDVAAQRDACLVVGALPAHVEVVTEARLAGAAAEPLSRADVRTVRVHPALVAHAKSSVVVGDRVTVATMPDGDRWVVNIGPRDTLLARPEVDKGALAQPLVANATTLWVVVAHASPPLRPGLVDRFFVAAASGGLKPCLVATKADLEADELSVDYLDLYESLGFRVIRTSATTGEGLDELVEGLTGGFGVLVGQSGVGKSSLVRAILPGEPIAVAEMSQATGKGRHTTTVTRWYGLPGGGAVVDTPGLRELGLWNATRAHLDLAFPDIATLAEGCRFDDCRHVSEPGCLVEAAFEADELDVSRIESYWKLSEEIDQRLRPGFGKPGGPQIRK